MKNTKLDLSKEYKSYYTSTTTPEQVEFGAIRYLSVCGKGDPDGDLFKQCIEVLYSAAYFIKFHYKAEQDFIVPKLEGLWWYDIEKFKHVSMANTALEIPRSEWEFRLLLRMPEFVEEVILEKAILQLKSKKQIEAFFGLDFFYLNEGLCMQILHVGPFSEEPVTLKILWEAIQRKGFAQNGLHHEIYLSDFRKTPPEKLKTILREPVILQQ